MYPAHTGIGGVRTQSSQPGPESIFIHYTTPSPHVAEQGINVILKRVTGRSHQFKSNVLYQIICYVIHSVYKKKKKPQAATLLRVLAQSTALWVLVQGHLLASRHTSKCLLCLSRKPRCRDNGSAQNSLWQIYSPH